ncbi:FkbM family methyltransferase [Phyllobacterium endophyticum]|uniref:FkbM family methyltransferase n=1 Tax=Phyllobacterium endophyticum TaxID=1149773 RepID=UPI0011CC592B|nr:FkbM family methyltransferase [Phyllobacterium endophyticum]TXR49022.1 FkbM family methyltransferase [Phyllobacterium endophyticum]
MTNFQRAGVEPQPGFPENYLTRIGTYISARLEPFAERFGALKRIRSRSAIRGDDRQIPLDELPKGDFAKVCHILHAAGSLRKDRTLLELGAASGEQTVEMATCGAFAHVLAVEPEAGNFKALRRNVNENGLENVVSCLPCAVGVVDGMTNFYVGRDDRHRSGMKQQRAHDSKVRTPINTIDTILQDAGVPPDRIGLVWIDIEGYEAIACLSMRRLMARSVPIYAVLSPDLYHRDHGTSLIRYLATYYNRCVLLTGTKTRMISISDIPLDLGTVRVLLID